MMTPCLNTITPEQSHKYIGVINQGITFMDGLMDELVRRFMKGLLDMLVGGFIGGPYSPLQGAFKKCVPVIHNFPLIRSTFDKAFDKSFDQLLDKDKPFESPNPVKVIPLNGKFIRCPRSLMPSFSGIFLDFFKF